MLEGKIALVTGSTSGIGLAVASALASGGADIMLHGLGETAQVEALRAGLEQTHKVRVFHNGADLAQPEAITDLIADTGQRLGSPDILINNAGIQHTDPIEDFPPEKWDAIIAINLTAAFHTTRLTVGAMKEKNWGRIINIASAHGLVASSNKAGYVAAKHGLVGLTKVVALETAETNITANAICPGWVRTELIERQIAARAEAKGITVEDGTRDLLAEKQPSKTFVTPEQIGEIALFLCSDAASQITGTALPVDGGWTAQ